MITLDLSRDYPEQKGTLELKYDHQYEWALVQLTVGEGHREESAGCLLTVEQMRQLHKSLSEELSLIDEETQRIIDAEDDEND